MMHTMVHPGEIIHEILINGAHLTVTEAAKALDVNRTTLSRLLNGHAGISAEMAARLSELLPSTCIKFWLNLQQGYDIWLLKKKGANFRIKPLKVA